LSCERLKTYFQTSAQEICAILNFFTFSSSSDSDRLKNQVNRNNVLYVVSYELSDDTSYFSNERTFKKVHHF
jgi:hypothetical protein